MKKSLISVVPILALLAACSGGGSSSGPLPQTPTVPAGSSSQTAPVNEAQSDTATPLQPLSVPSSNDLLYVGNTQNNSITVYRHDVSGNATPLHVIYGKRTQLNSPAQLSEDAAGNLYVANGGFSSASILVFAHGADGNVAPIREIAGPATRLHHVVGMTVDQATGKIFAVDDTMPLGQGATLLRFPPNWKGNQAPFASGTIAFWALELASDSTGKNIIESNLAECCIAFSAGVRTLPKQFYNGTSLNSIYDVNDEYSSGIADDPTTKSYLLTTPTGITRFTEDTAGDGADYGLPASFAPAIVGTITSDTCGTQVALGYLRNIYVSHSIQSGCATDAVYVYTHDSSGNVAPLRVLSGPSTGLSTPSGIYEGK